MHKHIASVCTERTTLGLYFVKWRKLMAGCRIGPPPFYCNLRFHQDYSQPQ